MNKKKLIIIISIIVLIAVCIILLIFFGPASPAPDVTIPAASDTAAPLSSASSDISSSSPSTSVDIPSLSGDDTVQYRNDRIELEYYDVPSDTFKKESVTVDDNTQLQFVMELVAQQFFEKPLSDTPIQPKSIKLKGNSIYIDFSKDIQSAPFGSSGDVALLDAIYNGYTKNIADITNIYFSIEGDDYETSHVEFSKNIPYQPKNS